jgi:hypothetical protein
MAQQVIDGMLYSPVLAHALRRGDMVHMPGVGSSRIVGVWQHGGCALLGLTNQRGTGELLVGWNLPVLRAVGAGVGGIA